MDRDRPLISVITPVYNTPKRYLRDLVDSFLLQQADFAELLLVDDGSTHQECKAFLDCLSAPGVAVHRMSENQGIVGATNLGMDRSKGEWVTFLDHDDALAPHALAVIRAAIEKHPDGNFFYTDEVVTGSDLAAEDLFLKPAFDRVLLSGVNYINHLSVYRSQHAKRLRLRAGTDGSQDYDLLLRYLTDTPDDTVYHVPYPAYLWRRDGRSYSVNNLQKATEAARRAVSDAYGGVAVGSSSVIPDLHRLAFQAAHRTWPSISVIIPNFNAPKLIRQVVGGLLDKTDYPTLEISIIDNGSDNPETLDFYRELTSLHSNVSIHIKKENFNFARAVNRGVSNTRSDFLLLLNNDVEIIHYDWLKEMVSCFDYGNVGAVGAKLLYPSGNIQHAGVIVGFGNYAGHWYLDQPGQFPGPMGRLAVRQSLSAVTGACLLTKRGPWSEVGGFDEQDFKIAYNDVDYCMRLRKRGYRILWTPFATLTHHESASRGSDETPENRERFEREKANLDRHHGTVGFEDPACNPWYTTDRSYPTLRRRAALPSPRTNAIGGSANGRANDMALAR
ncbi:glycosyltransferase family 2 protein [Phreatobacter oligotrophus]|uniref:glycosyltransferase family 2 protein n=1 Tax=Phreatobacter oligotrophus TaxID=1122261 RepID=UPI0014748A1E|nr:glycosyltransferase family 2 protein [Phreatobacter oligotrophus]